MTQINSPYYQTLYESNRLITLLESYADRCLFARDALARHRMLHNQLDAHRVRSEHALAAWRAALSHRWQCEIEGQRLYNHILEHARLSFGTESAEVKALVHSRIGTQAGSAEDLLDDMRRMHAALLLMQPSSPVLLEHIAQLAVACTRLEQALDATHRRETERRNATLERRLTYDACERAFAETMLMLVEHLGIPSLTETLDYDEADALVFA
ncbi:MAG: hypothetical protein HC893_16770 [Chloroflexaceae bacterium]|nr:hypothetical protein [Chloroflexaceae bacterium]